MNLKILPIDALVEMIKAFESGIIKGHRPKSWLDIKDWKTVYTGKIERHYNQFMGGIEHDRDSGLHPLAHLAADALIYMSCAINERKKNDRKI